MTNGSEVVLCTANKTYQLRQVSTSNTVYITTPIYSTSETTPIGEPGISAISQCTSTLETMAAPADSARDTLLQMLMPFAEPEDAERSSAKYLDQATVFSNTPMSDDECYKAWIKSVAFEMETSGSLPKRSYRPTATAALKAWKQVCELAASESDRIRLASPMGKNALKNVLLNSEEDQDWPVELRKAVLMRLIPLQDASMSDIYEWPTKEEVSLDRQITVQWVGVTIVQARQEANAKSSRQKDAFINEWKDALPEEWREDAKLDVLAVSHDCGFLFLYSADSCHNRARTKSRRMELSSTSVQRMQSRQQR